MKRARPLPLFICEIPSGGQPQKRTVMKRLEDESIRTLEKVLNGLEQKREQIREIRNLIKELDAVPVRIVESFN